MLWRDTLKAYSYEEFESAMTEMMKHPPKQTLEDGTTQPWTGMPKLPDVLQVMLARRDERKAQERATQVADELKELERQRAEHPEEFVSVEEFKKDMVRLIKEKKRTVH